MALGVDQNHRKAIGGLNGEQEAGSCGDESVAADRLSGNGIDVVDDVGVDLTDGNQGPEAVAVELRSTGQPRAAVPTWIFSCTLAGSGSEFPEEGGAVAFNRGAGVVFGEA
jgi:hypothetical protein